MKIEPNKINEITPKTEEVNSAPQKFNDGSAPAKEFKEACASFEAMFISQLLQQMKKSIPKGGFFGESKSKEMMEGLMDDECAKFMASSGGIGLANLLYQQFKDRNG